MSQRAILCPHCRKLIGSDEKVCSWCGTSRSNPWWRLVGLTGGTSADRVIKVLLTVNIVWFALSIIMSGGRGGFLSPSQESLFQLGATGTIPINRFGRIWSLLSANYLHGGIMHLIFNMMALRQIAPWVTTEFGVSRMFVIYTLGGICGYVVSYVAGVPFTIGASAAVCALIGSLLYFGKSRGGVYGSSVYKEVSGWVIGLFIFGLLFPGINNWGHGGGILGGILFGKLLGYNERKRETPLHRSLALVCAVTTIACLAWALFSAVQ